MFLPFKNRSHMVTRVSVCVCLYCFLCVNWPINCSITPNGRVFDVIIKLFFSLQFRCCRYVCCNISDQPFSVCLCACMLCVDRCKWVTFNFSVLTLINAHCTHFNRYTWSTSLCMLSRQKYVHMSNKLSDCILLLKMLKTKYTKRERDGRTHIESRIPPLCPSKLKLFFYSSIVHTQWVLSDLIVL